MSKAMTPTERQILSDDITDYLRSQTEPVTIDDLKHRFAEQLNKAAFSKFIRNRFQVVNGVVHLKPVTVEDANNLCHRLAKVVDRMAAELEAKDREIAKLLNHRSAPTLSERALRALAVYGD